MTKLYMRKLIILVVILLLALGLVSAAEKYLPSLVNIAEESNILSEENQKVKIITEESIVIDVVKKVGPSVVTIAAESTVADLFEKSDPFFFFNVPPSPSARSQEPHNIGSGFVISKEGIIVTNKHVVSDRNAKYTVVTDKDRQYAVQKIYRDPLNDIAILQVDPGQNGFGDLRPVELGDSSKLQVGQIAIAIGTPLGEFNNSVTRGIVSGLGRGIVAGSVFEGFAEELDNVIQTDAAINPGNSGGPLLNSAGQVIGINTAVSQGGENIGFALPINLVREVLQSFNQTGQFNRPYLGVAYRMVSRELSVRNQIPEGAYVETVVKDSSAEKSGVRAGDIITHFDGKRLQQNNAELSRLISAKKVGDTVAITLYRENENGEGQEIKISATLENAPDQ